MLNDAQWNLYKEKYDLVLHELNLHMDIVERFFSTHPELMPIHDEKIHSTKKRLKDIDHLRAKIERKLNEGKDLSPDNLFDKITDLAGVRLLLLFQADFEHIDKIIRYKVDCGDWFLAEKPKAYTWDPESVQFFQKFDLDVISKDTSYTSVHYLIKPKEISNLCCELQVRTLFEEIWGEVDHRINYPVITDSVTCKEQILVLSKIVGAGSRLLESIRKSLDV